MNAKLHGVYVAENSHPPTDTVHHVLNLDGEALLALLNGHGCYVKLRDPVQTGDDISAYVVNRQQS